MKKVFNWNIFQTLLFFTGCLCFKEQPKSKSKVMPGSSTSNIRVAVVDEAQGPSSSTTCSSDQKQMHTQQGKFTYTYSTSPMHSPSHQPFSVHGSPEQGVVSMCLVILIGFLLHRHFQFPTNLISMLNTHIIPSEEFHTLTTCLKENHFIIFCYQNFVSSK